MSKTPRVDRLLEEARVNGECPYARAIIDNLNAYRGEQSAARLIQLLHACRIEPLPNSDALYQAMNCGDKEAVRDLVRLGLCDPVTTRGPYGGTILHAAVRSSDLECAKQAYRLAPCLLDVRDSTGDTPLYDTVYESQVDIARFFLERGASIHVNSVIGDMLFYALEAHDRDGDLPGEFAKLVFAYGLRLKPENRSDLLESEHAFLNTLVSRLHACGRAAMVMMGLNRAGGKTRGNGRDALRLVARMVWVYRVDEAWDDLIWDDVGQAKNKRYKK